MDCSTGLTWFRTGFLSTRKSLSLVKPYFSSHSGRLTRFGQKQEESMYSGIVDIHAHMDDPCFRGITDLVLSHQKAHGVERIIQSGSELVSSQRSVAMAEKHDMISASVGVYPNEVVGLPDHYIDQLRELAKSSQVVAIGEIGMDYGYELHPPAETQEKAFREQLSLAVELNLPVVIHNREADADVIRILQDYPSVHGAIHRVFSPLKYARILLKMGFYMSIGPQITYPDSECLVDLAREIPMSQLLLETDAPFLPTYGMKEPPLLAERRIEGPQGIAALPSMIADVAEKIASVRNDCTPQEIIDATRVNAEKLFRLPI